MKHIYVILMLAFLLSFGSCNVSNPEAIHKNDIRNILYDISIAYNEKDHLRIMNNVHQDYLHDGKWDYDLREYWRSQMAIYSLLSISSINISLDDYLATASFIIKFEDASGSQEFYAPSQFGYCSYFLYEQGKWQLIGNQRY